MANKFPNLTEFNEVINAASIDTWDDDGVYRQKYEHWALRGFRLLNMRLLRHVERQIIPVDPITKAAALPKNCLNWIFVGKIDSKNNRVPYGVNYNIAPPMKSIATTCTSKCSDAWCKDFVYELTTQQITVASVPYTKTVKRLIDCDGWYIEETIEPIAVYKVVDGTTVLDYVSTDPVVKRLFKLDTKPCGCIEKSDSNIKKLLSCGCSFVHYEVPVNHNFKYHFNVFPEEGIIQFDPEFAPKDFYLEFIGDLPCINGIYYIPTIALEAVVAFVKHKAVQDKKGVSDGDKVRKELEWMHQRKELRKDVMRTTIAQIVESLNVLPVV